MNKKQLLSQLKNDVYCRLGQSKIAGVGVFAIKDIPKGTNPFKDCDIPGHITLSKKDLKGVDKEVIKYVRDMFVFENGKFWLPSKGLQALDISYFLNHSKNPNMVAIKSGEEFISIRKIKKGEELTSNYLTYDNLQSNKKFKG